MKKLVIGGLLAVIGFSCSDSQYRSVPHRDRVYTYERRVNHRVENSKIASLKRNTLRKIESGRRRGDFSRKSYSRLMRRYHQIEMQENRFNRNGRFTISEERQLEREWISLDRLVNQELRRNNRRF